MPPAPFQTVLTTTRDLPSPAGVTRQVVTIEELRSFSTSSPSVGSLTSSRQSRTRLLVAWSFQWTRVPSPSPPSRTSYSLKCSGITFHEIRARSIVNRVPGASRMPFEWTVNPYRGCTHACVYCFARKTHSYLDFDAGMDFDSQVVVKVNAAEIL